MSYIVTIQGQPIELPSVSASPNWAPGQVAFNQAVANALQFAVGTFDIPPQTYTMIADINSNVQIPGLAFPVSQVRAAYLYYYIFRQTNSSNECESGLITMNYNPNNTTGNLWSVARQGVGNSTVSFSVSDAGQVSFSSANLTGSDHVGTIGFYAKVLQQQY